MRSIIRGLMAVAAAGSCMSTFADTRQYSLDIERQSLRETLVELSKQTGFQVGLFSRGEEDEAVVVGPLKGRYSVECDVTVVLLDSVIGLEKQDQKIIDEVVRWRKGLIVAK